MKKHLVHKRIFLGFIVSFMNFGKLWANDVSNHTNFSKNSNLTIHTFVTKNALNTTPLIVETDLEYDDSQTFQQNSFSSDNTIQSLSLLFGYNDYSSKNVANFHAIQYLSIKRYLLNCIFLI